MVNSGTLSFFGEHEYKVDTQGRISMPARYRDAFRGGLILTRGHDRCIAAYTPNQWETWANNVASYPMNRQKNRRYRRMTFAGAYSLQSDRQGRVPLPSMLRSYANIDINGDVVVAGMGDFLEIWAKEEWMHESALLEQEAQYIAETAEDSR